MPKRKDTNKKPIVGEVFKITVDVTIQKFLSTEDAKEWEYPSSFTAVERAYIHLEANKHGLKSKSRGKGSKRFLTIYKRDGSAIMQKDATIVLSPPSRTLMLGLLHKHPVTSREKQDSLPPQERTKDSFQDGKEGSKALGRLCGGTAGVPPSFSNRSLQPFRASLPTFPLKETIVHTINDNQVTIIIGETGSGKTTQIPNYLLEWHERMGRACRIICCQPRRLGAVTVSERVAIERGEKVGQAVGYQIRLEGRISPYTVLTYCTSGVLMRSLVCGDSVLACATHIIVDEMHERDALTDLLLIVLREAIGGKFRSLRLVLMSATADAQRFSAYFNNCPIVTVPGKMHEVKSYFLEDILKQTGYMSSKMEKLRKEFDRKKMQKAQLEKWTAAVNGLDSGAGSSISESPIMPEEQVGSSEMDFALSEAWVHSSESAFGQILYLIQSENVPVDYQHCETGVTALMAAAVRGKLEAVERLLEIGADVNIKTSNNFTALDWAVHVGQQDVADLIQAYMVWVDRKEFLVSEQSSTKELSETDRELLELYQSTINDELIDMQLILSLITMILNESNKGSILVFLAGYDDIARLKEVLMMEEKRLSQKGKIIILMLHSNMQTSDQKLVFKPTPVGARKIILSTNIAETSITIDDVVYVIDTGKVKEKSYNALTGVSQLASMWVCKSCALQRRGRAGRTQPGVCYHLYSSIRFEAMPMYNTPELLRIPLHELCLYTKQLAPPNTSIVDFLSKALDPPSSLISRSAVSLLKTIDALDTWEDLTDLGHHLVDLPVDPRYGKMLIYATILKCLDPVLTIVSCLSYGELFTLPTAAERRKDSAQERVRFSAGSLSDHMVLLRIFQSWQEAKKQCRDRQFCSEHCINGATLELVLGTRAQLLAQLRASGFVKSKGHGDIKYVNSNSDNWALVKATLVAGLYPNLARVDREHNVLRTVKEHKVGVHVRSVLSNGGGRGEKVVSKLPSDWIVYEELTKVGRLAMIRNATVISPITVALFAGPARIPFDAISDSHIDGSEGSDSEEEDLSPELTATFKLDDWIVFRMDSQSAQLAAQLRIKWHSLVTKKLRSVNKMLSGVDELVINTIVRVLSAEEQCIGLTQPAGVGRRPYLMNSDLPAIVNRGLEDESSGLAMDRMHRNSPAKLNFERFNGGNKNVENEIQSPPQPFGNSVDIHRGALPVRYFIIQIGHSLIKEIDTSVIHKTWAFKQATYYKILQAYKSGKTVILLFHALQGRNGFLGSWQGYARVTGESVDGSARGLPVEWIKRAALPFPAGRHLANPYADNSRLLHTCKDGQEIEPSVAEALIQLWDAPPHQMGSGGNTGGGFPGRSSQPPQAQHNPQQSTVQQGLRQQQQSDHGYHNSNYKM